MQETLKTNGHESFLNLFEYDIFLLEFLPIQILNIDPGHLVPKSQTKQ